MTHDEKVPYMMKWWVEAHASLIKQKLSKHGKLAVMREVIWASHANHSYMYIDLAKMARQVNLEMRKGVEDVLTNCRDTQIPFLVFSAGIGNIIEEILKQVNMLHENMHIVSNMMVFDDQDICVDFKEPLIHVFNKSEFQLETSPYHKLIEERANVILMGDSLGDLQMSQGVQHDLCFNIGFLNHDIKVLEPAYTEAFDLVIEGDANMAPVLEILKSIE